MPNSSVTHTVDVRFTLDEIMDLLRDRADHITYQLSAVNRMVYDSATTNLEDDEPHFVLHYVAEAS